MSILVLFIKLTFDNLFIEFYERFVDIKSLISVLDRISFSFMVATLNRH